MRTAGQVRNTNTWKDNYEWTLDRTGDDGIECRQAIQLCRIAQTLGREKAREVALLTVQGHVVENNRLDQQVDLVGCRRCVCFFDLPG